MLNSRDDKIRTCDHTPPQLLKEYLYSLVFGYKSVIEYSVSEVQCCIYSD